MSKLSQIYAGFEPLFPNEATNILLLDKKNSKINWKVQSFSCKDIRFHEWDTICSFGRKIGRARAYFLLMDSLDLLPVSRENPAQLDHLEPWITWPLSGWRTFQPRTFQPQASTPDFSTMNFPTSDFSTSDFSTTNF